MWAQRVPSALSLRKIYQKLFRALGPQGWWPADSAFEMMLGAILTQATNWHNVEQAIQRLAHTGALQPREVLAIPTRRLEQLVRPAGYFRQKAKRVKVFTQWYVDRYAGRARRMFRTPWRKLREELLALHGIGPETADSMLLYAGQQPVFVIDAYTTRIFRRHRLIRGRATYDTIQRWVMQELPADTQLYNEYHALLVSVGKQFCHRRHPDCNHCPLGKLPRTLEVNIDGSW